LKQAVSVETKLIAGKDGIFDVKLDGKVIFSKDKEYRFPADGELVTLVGAR
jgi:predicted Rdx family selenoprotein